MNVTRVEGYAQPRIPTRLVIDERPELLRLVPKRWQRNSVVLAALAGVAVLASACRSGQPAPLMGKPAPPRMILTEEEARRIINDEAKAAGIVFATDRKSLNVTVPAKPGKDGKARVQKARIKLDGTDAKHKVSFEYVSQADRQVWSAMYPGWQVGAYQAGASSVEEILEKAQPKERFGVFYDPLSWSDEDNREKLRAQVQEFVKWLKGRNGRGSTRAGGSVSISLVLIR